MGVLRLNGKAYGGGIDVIEVTQAQYNALPESKLSDDILYVISDSVNGSDGYPPLIYSTEEREVGVWIDGKPLYQKSFYVSNVTVNSWQSITHGISNLENIAKTVGEYKRDSDGLSFPVNYYESNSVFIAFQTNNTTIDYKVNGITTGSIFITLQYTKTTDTKGSGRWTTQGTLAQHYSTTERLIGTWIDGKPLYEKTVISTTTPTANAWNTVDLPANISVKTYDAYYMRSTGGVDKFSVYRGDTNPVEMLVCSLNNSTVYYRISSPFVDNFSEFVIIVQYTKTTD